MTVPHLSCNRAYRDKAYNTTNSAVIEIYEDFTKKYEDTAEISNALLVSILKYDGYFVVDDIDNDTQMEIAYLVYVAGNDGNNTYSACVLKNYTAIWSDKGWCINNTLLRLDYGYGAYPFIDGFIFLMEASKFIHVLYDGSTTLISLNGDNTWASEGVMTSLKETVLEAHGGYVHMNITGSIRCVGDYGFWTYAVCVLNNRTMIRVLGSVDVDYPSGQIYVPGVCNDVDVTVNFTADDDLDVQSVLIRLDDNP